MPTISYIIYYDIISYDKQKYKKNLWSAKREKEEIKRIDNRVEKRNRGKCPCTHVVRNINLDIIDIIKVIESSSVIFLLYFGLPITSYS